jgi:hypothetical protein
MARVKISRATGIPIDNIMVSSTHTHSAPSCATSTESISQYIKNLQTVLVDIATVALEDRKDAQMFTASTKLDGMNFVRHYVMDDGSIVGDNFGTTSGKKYIKHVSEPDNTMQLIQFARNGGKDVVLVNWQAHTHRGGGANNTIATSDIVGVIREKMESSIDCLFAYFSGASGNVNSHSRISSENATSNYVEQGQVMGQYAIEALKSRKAAQIGKVQIIGQNFTAKEKPSRGSGTYDLPIFAFSIGSVGFVTLPGEMFSENGLQIKEGSPFDMTFVVTYANSHYYYIPPESAFEYNSYEASVSRVEKGTVEKLVTEYGSMLNTLYKTRF